MKKIFCFLMVFAFIGQLSVKAESLDDHTPVSNDPNETFSSPMQYPESNIEKLEVKPVIPSNTDINITNSDLLNKTESILEEELDFNPDINYEPFALIGPNDRRVRVTNTTVFPNSAITYVYTRWPNGNAGRCTGFIISNDAVATAGHCVYNHQYGGWATSVTVRPGANGANNFPYGAFESRKVYSVNGWVNDKKTTSDYGVVKISGTFPASTGRFGYGVATNNNFQGKFARLTGYPAIDPNKPLYTQWMHSGTIDLIFTGLTYHDADMTDGQSGSPIYLKEENIARSINVGNMLQPRIQNIGVTITSGVYTNLNNWANQ